MKLGIMSDLHLEFDSWPWEYRVEPDVTYVNAGDIDPNPDARKSWIKQHAMDIWCPGNHEYYGGHFPMEPYQKVFNISPNLTLATATLWTDLSNYLDWTNYTQGLNDASIIRGLTYDIYNRTHKADLEFLMESGADVIMTHHSPSFRSVGDQFKKSPYNPAYHSNLDDLLLGGEFKKTPLLWIHGHTHIELDYMIGETRVVCHPRGYPHEAGHKNYAPKIVVL